LDRDRAITRSWRVDALPASILLDGDLKPRFAVHGEFDWQGDAGIDAALRSIANTPKRSEDQPPLKEDRE
jgi:hypothetical protein